MSNSRTRKASPPYNKNKVKRGLRRGDIYIIAYGNESTIGSEQGKTRPYIIVSNNKGNQFSSLIVAVPMTTQEKNKMPTHVEIAENKFNVYGVALCENINTFDKMRIKGYLGRVTEEEVNQINQALSIVLGLETKSHEGD